VKREEEQAPERQADDGRRDQAPNLLQMTLLTLTATPGATIRRGATWARNLGLEIRTGTRRGPRLEPPAPAPPSYR
jgi:hypothetical protein